MGRRGTTAAFGDADAHLAEVLAELEGAENYKAWLLELLGPWMRGAVLEVGAGRGTYSLELRQAGTSLVAVEPSVQAAAVLHERTAGANGVDVVVGTVADVDRDDFETAVMLNVLEHIEDDLGVLREIHDRLAPGGRLCVWVPAFEVLMGDFDRRIGHHRRYRIGDLRQRATEVGFEIDDARYANLPGFFAWLLVVRLLRGTPTTGGLSQVYDRFVVPVVRAIERRVRVPFGQSLLVVLRKPG